MKTNDAPIFGPQFSACLVRGCATLSRPGFPVGPRWILDVFALESGFDHKLVKNGYGGLFMKKLPYSCPAPHIQMADAIRFWSSQIKDVVRSREDLYLANLAPARLSNPERNLDTIVYSANPEDVPLNATKGGASTYWIQAYHQNSGPFGLDPGVLVKDASGRVVGLKVSRGDARLRVRDLAKGLDKYAGHFRSRIDRELEAAHLANVMPDEPPPDAA